MAVYSEKDLDTFQKLKKICLDYFTNISTLNISELAINMMKQEGVPMHYPFHHFIVPAALLTATAYARGDSAERLSEMLDLAMERAKDVPGGSCGNWGACGAGIGAGIYISIYTDCTPMSGEIWGWANELTGRCLQAISTVPGPRCCKRTTFLSICESVSYVNEKLGVNLSYNVDQICPFSSQNSDCQKNRCPFFAERGTSIKTPIFVPDVAMPKKDPIHPCPCQDRPVYLQYKSGTIQWLATVGDTVEKGQVICEGEVEKKALEFCAPCEGLLAELCLKNGDTFSAGDVLGYIESEK